MAITYEWYENPNAEGEKEERGLHPRLLLNGKVTTEQLCARIRDRSSLAVGDVKSAITTLAELCGEELCEGREVHIEGLGYFFPILQTTQQVTRSTPHKSTKVKLKSIGFRPDTRLKGYMQGLKVEQSKYVHHSSGLSETEMEMRLTEYSAEHEVMIRIDFKSLCGLTRTTANRHLKRLTEEGKLINIGRLRQPIYRPAPGHYGVSLDK